MKSRPFLDNAIKQIGVVDFVMENISQIHIDPFAEELVFPLILKVVVYSHY